MLSHSNFTAWPKARHITTWHVIKECGKKGPFSRPLLLGGSADLFVVPSISLFLVILENGSFDISFSVSSWTCWHFFRYEINFRGLSIKGLSSKGLLKKFLVCLATQAAKCGWLPPNLGQWPPAPVWSLLHYNADQHHHITRYQCSTL